MRANQGDEHRYDRRVVEERGQKGGGHHDAQQHRDRPAASTQQGLGEHLQRARLAHRSGDHQEDGNGGDGRVAEASEGRLRGEHTRDHQHAQSQEHDDIGSQPLARHRPRRDPNHRQGVRHMPTSGACSDKFAHTPSLASRHSAGPSSSCALLQASSTVRTACSRMDAPSGCGGANS